MAKSPKRARQAVFGKAAEALNHDTDQMAERWATAFRRRVSERGEPFPTDDLEQDVEALVKGVASVLNDPWSYRTFIADGEHQQIGQQIAAKHVRAGGSLTSALDAYMRLRQAMILASRDVFRESDRPFFDVMTRLNRCIDRILFAIAEGYFSAFQAEIEKQALSDPLTGLGNSRRFREALSSELKRSSRTGRPFSIVFVDVDDFKDINDEFGHVHADYILTAIGRTIGAQLRGSDLLCRWGGDEFIILLPSVESGHAPGKVAKRIIDTLSSKYQLDDHDCYVSASIGITLYPLDGTHSDELIKNADLAMYHAKANGKNSYQYYNDSMNVAAFERMAVENRLRKALENDQLLVHYQPQVDAASGAIVGMEALLRWHDPDEGLVPPSAFIPVAEESGLILPIGERVLREACREARTWQRRNGPPVLVSINVSSVQFTRQDVARLVADALEESGLDPGALEIEITESTIMDDPDRAIKTLRRIKQQGVRIALDDFGTGYSSLSHLRRFPIDTLKIDRSFILDIERKREDAEIVAAIIAMAHSLRLRVVVEGVESENQRRMVVERDCDLIQGYLFSPPVAAGEVPEMLARGTLGTGEIVRLKPRPSPTREPPVKDSVTDAPLKRRLVDSLSGCADRR